MKALFTSLLLFPLSIFAHPGHAAPTTHGDGTHLVLGLIIALVIALPVAFILQRLNVRKREAVKVSKQD